MAPRPDPLRLKAASQSERASHVILGRGTSHPPETDHLWGNDGIVTTFAIVAGFAGAEAQGVTGLGALAVLIFGLANLTADAVSMGMGEFLSGRSAPELFRTRHARVRAKVARDSDGMTPNLIAQGLAPDRARRTADYLATSPELMAGLVLRYDYGMEAPEAHDLRARALMAFLAFVAFGAISETVLVGGVCAGVAYLAGLIVAGIGG